MITLEANLRRYGIIPKHHEKYIILILFSGVTVALEVERSATNGKVGGLIPRLLQSACQRILGQDTEQQVALRCIPQSVNVCEC